jgi:hypothetical protein
MLGLVLMLTAALALTDAHASGSHHKHTDSTKTSHASGDSHAGYINSKGNWVPSPTHTSNGKAPKGATARCADGSYSFSQSHRGTCSHHGGVTEWQPSPP